MNLKIIHITDCKYRTVCRYMQCPTLVTEKNLGLACKATPKRHRVPQYSLHPSSSNTPECNDFHCQNFLFIKKCESFLSVCNYLCRLTSGNHFSGVAMIERVC